MEDELKVGRGEAAREGGRRLAKADVWCGGWRFDPAKQDARVGWQGIALEQVPGLGIEEPGRGSLRRLRSEWRAGEQAASEERVSGSASRRIEWQRREGRANVEKQPACGPVAGEVLGEAVVPVGQAGGAVVDPGRIGGGHRSDVGRTSARGVLGVARGRLGGDWSNRGWAGRCPCGRADGRCGLGAGLGEFALELCEAFVRRVKLPDGLAIDHEGDPREGGPGAVGGAEVGQQAACRGVRGGTERVGRLAVGIARGVVAGEVDGGDDRDPGPLTFTQQQFERIDDEVGEIDVSRTGTQGGETFGLWHPEGKDVIVDANDQAIFVAGEKRFDQAIDGEEPVVGRLRRSARDAIECDESPQFGGSIDDQAPEATGVRGACDRLDSRLPERGAGKFGGGGEEFRGKRDAEIAGFGPEEQGGERRFGWPTGEVEPMQTARLIGAEAKRRGRRRSGRHGGVVVGLVT